MNLSLALTISFFTLILTITLLSLLLLLLLVGRHRRRLISNEQPTIEAAASAANDTVHRYRWSEIESITGNFTVPIIGQGGFSTVYLAGLPGKRTEEIAVKVHRCGGGGERLLRAFRQELDLLKQIQHPNIVRLFGFSDDHEEEGALLLEYLPNGNLHQKLHVDQVNDGITSMLTWQDRTRILYDVAGAIEYLHDSMDPPVIHCDVTASNILLDCQLSARLCDFGSARAGFSAAVTRSGGTSAAIGSPGYTDPYYLRTGIASKKSDVYSFGVLILEVVTGLPAVGSDGRNLTAEILPRVSGGLQDLVDGKLRGEFDSDEAAELAAIAVRCVAAQPSLRPAMAEIRAVMRERFRLEISAVHRKSDDRKS